MDVNVKLRVRTGDIARTGGPAVAVNLYAGVKEPGGATAAVDKAAGGVVARALRNGDFKGDLEEVLVLYPSETGAGVPERVILIGLGDKERFDAEAARRVGGALVGALRRLKVKRAATVVHGGDSGKGVRELARALAEGILLGAYRYDTYLRDGRAEPLVLEEVAIVERLAGRARAVQQGVRLGEAVAGSVNEARELANGPSNQVTPTFLAEAAKKLGARHGFKVRVLGPEECAKEGMGAFLGVAKGSDEPCRFLVMEYEGARPKGTVCLVGKGITFDSGGISIKPAEAMDQMKFDMSGGAAVIATMGLAARTKVPLKVVGLVAATENLPGGHAYKPGDILESAAGVTIEVLNTDAEGRLVLADALAYASRYHPDAVVDLATLTGACQIALGSFAAGLMANDEWILDRLYGASLASGERVWPLPLWKEYREMVKSDVADIKNTAGRPAGAITAGAFLGAFTNQYRWAHLDIAGTAWTERGPRASYQPAGATGAGVRLLTDFLHGWSRPKGKGPQAGLRTSLGPVRERAATKAAGKAAAEPRAKASPKPNRRRRAKAR